MTDEPSLPLGLPNAGMDQLSAFVVSDLHAHSRRKPPTSSKVPSWLSVSATNSDAKQDALVSLFELLDEDESIRADLLICCGDIVDQANPSSLNYIWTKLNELKSALNARHLLVTSGNHDVDSYHQYNEFDARGQLQGLNPRYPIDDVNLSDKYWSRHFFVSESEQCRILVLNSAAYHGHGDEWKHGRVSNATIQMIAKELDHHSPLNILVMHHHIEKNSAIDPEDYSEIKNADALLQFLEENDLGPWVIIHGHRHHPRLRYTDGGSAIFSAGSMARKLYPEVNAVARNQAYLLTFETSGARELGLDLAGTFRSWDFIFAKGWQPATDESGLPHVGGFGCLTARTQLALQIDTQINAAGPSVSWEDLCSALPELKFVSPNHLTKLRSELSHKGLVPLPKPPAVSIHEVGRA